MISPVSAVREVVRTLTHLAGKERSYIRVNTFGLSRHDLESNEESMKHLYHVYRGLDLAVTVEPLLFSLCLAFHYERL